MDNKNKMGTMPMPRLLAVMSLPLMLSLLVQSLYNIVDSMFVARVGQAALTAVSLAFPVQLLMIALSVGMSVGVNSLLARSLGAGDSVAVGLAAKAGVVLAALGTVVFAVGGAFARGLAAGMAGDEAIAELCAPYLGICMVWCAGTFVSTMYQRFLQAAGNTFASMLCLLTGAAVNLVLDPIFIFGYFGMPAMGVKGAAIATVLGQWADAALAVWINVRRNPAVTPAWRTRPGWTVYRRIFAVGLPTAVTQALASVMLLAVNSVLISFSGAAVAFFGIFYKMQDFLMMPIRGLGQAAIPIAGYNYGAKRNDRILALLKAALSAAATLSAVMAAVFFAFPRELLGLFKASGEMLSVGVPALRIICPTFVLAALTTICGYALSGLGSGLVNMVGTLLRQIIVLLPLVKILSARGLSSVWWAFWPAELIAAAYAAWATVHELRGRGVIKA